MASLAKASSQVLTTLLLLSSAVPAFALSTLVAYPSPQVDAEASSSGAGKTCFSNGFLNAQVDETSGMYSFGSGTCATASNVANYILFSIGTSFLSVADFTSGIVYTEAGTGGGTSLGFPESSRVMGRSIVTVFPQTPEGLVVTQNITVSGTTFASSTILMEVNVVNNNPSAQRVGVRYLWDTQVSGYDGTWLRQYDGATPGAITGYEVSFTPPPPTFTSYVIGGCSQGIVIPPPYVCSPSNFGPGSGTLTVAGSISSGPGATTPARFVYGWWRTMFASAYAYLADPTVEIGSYVQSVGGNQDSAIMYYFTNQTLAGGGGSLADQADITTSPSSITNSLPNISLAPLAAVPGATVTVSGTGLIPSTVVTMTSFGSFGPVPLFGNCTVGASGTLPASSGCSFHVPSFPNGAYTLEFRDGTEIAIGSFIIGIPGIETTATSLGVTCSRSAVVVGSLVTCTATVVALHSSPTGSVGWSSSVLAQFSSASCKLSRRGLSGTCSVSLKPLVSSSGMTISATYGGDARNLPSVGNLNVTAPARASTITVSCTPSSVPSSSSKTISCRASVSGYFPTGDVIWSQTGVGNVTYVLTECTLAFGQTQSVLYAKLRAGPPPRGSALSTCTVTLLGARPGPVTLRADYEGDLGNLASFVIHGVAVGKASTKGTVSCSPTGLTKGATTSCLFSVLNGFSPTGSVTWSKISGSGGVTFSSTTCAIVSGSCSITITTTAAGTPVIRGTYSGDLNNLKSSGTVTLTIT